MLGETRARAKPSPYQKFTVKGTHQQNSWRKNVREVRDYHWVGGTTICSAGAAAAGAASPVTRDTIAILATHDARRRTLLETLNYQVQSQVIKGVQRVLPHALCQNQPTRPLS